jgi:hypothetical protein
MPSDWQTFTPPMCWTCLPRNSDGLVQWTARHRRWQALPQGLLMKCIDVKSTQELLTLRQAYGIFPIECTALRNWQLPLIIEGSRVLLAFAFTTRSTRIGGASLCCGGEGSMSGRRNHLRSAAV